MQRRLLELIDFFEHPLQALNEDIEHQLTQLAVTLAQQLVRRELKVEPGEIVGLIRDSRAAAAGQCAQYLDPAASRGCRLVRERAVAGFGDEEHQLEAGRGSDDYTRGGCEIKAPPSAINATLENRLSALAASVLGGEREQDE